MRKFIYLLGILMFIGLFIASPYILDYWQNQSALEAAGGMAVFEGALKTKFTQCEVCTPYPVCCKSSELCAATPPLNGCSEQQITVLQSAGGQKCPNGYIVSAAQAAIAQGAQNVILGGTTCLTIQVLASEKGCIGCMAAINNEKVYYVKNKIKSLIDKYIIAGFRDK